MVEFLPIFHPRIETDLREAMARYDANSPGLGDRFKREFYANVDDLLVFPARHPIKLPPDIR